MTTRIVTQTGSQRRLRSKNVGSGVIPTFGCIQLANSAEFDREGILYHVDRPRDIYGLRGEVTNNIGGLTLIGEWVSCDGVGFNLENPILPGEIGEVTFDTPAFCRASEPSSQFSLPTGVFLATGFELENITSHEPWELFKTAFLSAFRVIGPVSIGRYLNEQNTAEPLMQSAFIAIRCRINQFYGEDINGGIFV